MPERRPVAYHFEGEPLDEVVLPAHWQAPARWAKALPAALLAPAARQGGPRLRLVGVLGVGRGLLVVLPKYLRFRPADAWQQPTTSYAAEAALLLRVLRRYQHYTPLHLPDPAEADEEPADFFAGEPALALALIDDYLAHGYWHHAQTELTTWDGAQPDWPRTVARAQPLLTANGPLYPVRYGYRRPASAGGATLVERLHRWAVRYCLETYADLLPGFAETSYDPETADELAELGEPDYLRQVLAQVRRDTYHDTQLHTLHLLERLILPHSDGEDEQQTLSVFGTTAFHRVWEVACQAAFAHRGGALLAQLPTPTWHRADGTAFQNLRNRLIPDIVWFDQTTLFVADAKYYQVSFTAAGRVVGGPGMPDLTKQLLYQQALLPLLAHAGHAIAHEHNVFLLPTDRVPQDDETGTDWLWGHAQTNIPGWEHRQVTIWLVPPACVFRVWLAHGTLQWQP